MHPKDTIHDSDGKGKLCPVISVNSQWLMSCREGKCAWWVQPYTTEGLPAGGMCAIEMIAMRTADGQYRV